MKIRLICLKMGRVLMIPFVFVCYSQAQTWTPQGTVETTSQAAIGASPFPSFNSYSSLMCKGQNWYSGPGGGHGAAGYFNFLTDSRIPSGSFVAIASTLSSSNLFYPIHVGNTATDIFTVDGAGNTVTHGNISITGANILEFGNGVAGKEVNAGKIGYGTFSSGASLDIVGAGTAGNNRKVTIFSEGGATIYGSVGVGNSPLSGYTLSVSGNANVKGMMTIGDITQMTTPNTYPGVPKGYSLYVLGGVLTEQVNVALKSTTSWYDGVFEEDYKLQSLKEVETYVKENKHLPNFPSAEELVKSGINVAQMEGKLLEKIEELTLHMIALEKKNEKLEEQVKVLEKKIRKE